MRNECKAAHLAQSVRQLGVVVAVSNGLCAKNRSASCFSLPVASHGLCACGSSQPLALSHVTRKFSWQSVHQGACRGTACWWHWTHHCSVCTLWVVLALRLLSCARVWVWAGSGTSHYCCSAMCHLSSRICLEAQGGGLSLLKMR